MLAVPICLRLLLQEAARADSPAAGGTTSKGKTRRFRCGSLEGLQELPDEPARAVHDLERPVGAVQELGVRRDAEERVDRGDDVLRGERGLDRLGAEGIGL